MPAVYKFLSFQFFKLHITLILLFNSKRLRHTGLIQKGVRSMAEANLFLDNSENKIFGLSRH